MWNQLWDLSSPDGINKWIEWSKKIYNLWNILGKGTVGLVKKARSIKNN